MSILPEGPLMRVLYGFGFLYLVITIVSFLIVLLAT